MMMHSSSRSRRTKRQRVYNSDSETAANRTTTSERAAPILDPTVPRMLIWRLPFRGLSMLLVRRGLLALQRQALTGLLRACRSAQQQDNLLPLIQRVRGRYAHHQQVQLPLVVHGRRIVPWTDNGGGREKLSEVYA